MRKFSKYAIETMDEMQAIQEEMRRRIPGADDDSVSRMAVRVHEALDRHDAPIFDK